jgi:pimeloyl-ACP methyl ester carboxylesterase
VERLHVVEEGDRPEVAGSERPLVVLVHGALDRGASFSRTARVLRNAGVHTIRYDRRGYGGSLEVGPGGVDDHVSDLLAVLDERPATVVGHSFGGVVALAAAQQVPDVVRSVVAFEAPMPWVDWWPKHSAGADALARPRGDGTAAGDAAETFMRRMIGDERWERLPSATRETRRAEGPAMLADLASLRRAYPPYRPERILCPVLSACGTRSAAHHRQAAEQLASLVPHGRLEVVEGSDHGVHLSHGATFAELILTMVDATGSGGRGMGAA